MDYGYAVVQTADGCYYVTGQTIAANGYYIDILFVKFAPDGSTCLGYAHGFNSDMMPVAGNDDNFEARRIDNFTDTPVLDDTKIIKISSSKIKQNIKTNSRNSRGFVTPTTTIICN